jgi:PST family polysaccharide transporter
MGAELVTSLNPADVDLVDERLHAGRKAGTSPAQIPKSLRASAAHGFIWMSSQTALAKLVGICSQVFLAWLLARDDFGVISKVFAVTAFPALIYQIGVKEVLVRRASALDRWSSVAYWILGSFGLLSAIAMIAAAPLAARFYYGPHPYTSIAVAASSWRLTWLIVIIAAAAPFTALSNVPTIRLQQQLRFKELATITFANSCAIAGLSILFALLKCHAYSFVLPWPIAAFLRFVWLCRRAPLHFILDMRLSRWRYLLSDSLMVMIARGIGTFVVVGDYLALGYFHSETSLGVYYFAYGLSMQTMMLVATNMESVLLPILGASDRDRAQQRKVVMGTVRSLATIGIPACCLQAILAEPGIRAVFNEKWYPAIPVLQVLSLGMAFRIVGWPTVSIMLAHARYKALLLMLALSSAQFMALVIGAASMSSEHNSAVAVAVAVSLHFIIEAPVYLYVAMRPLGVSVREVSLMFVGPLVSSVVALYIANNISAIIPGCHSVQWLRIVVIISSVLSVYLMCLWLTDRKAFMIGADQLRRILRSPVVGKRSHLDAAESR